MKSDNQGIFACRPILAVNSVAKSLIYYCDILGFKAGLTWSEEKMAFLGENDNTAPTWALIGRDKIQVMLSERCQGSSGMWLHLDVQTADEIDQLFGQWSTAGANIMERS